MNTKRTIIWYWILVGELLSASFLFLLVSFFAEHLGIDSGGNWGARRISIALMGSVLSVISFLLWLFRNKIIAKTNKVAQFSCYVTKSTMWILVALGLLEFILQTTVSSLPEMNYEEDWGRIPVSGSIRSWGEEGFGITHYLPHGEIATPFDDGAISIIVLGDSHTEALQVSDGDKFVSIAETNLRSNGKDVNLHNLGRSGNSIPDYIYLAPMIKQHYNPKIIVVQLSSLDGADSFDPKHNNYFVINDMGGLELRHKNQYTSNNELRIGIYTLGQNRYSQITEKISAKSNGNNQFQPASTSSIDVRINEQLQLLNEAYSGTKVILLLLPYLPNIDKNNIIFDDSEYLVLLEFAENTGGFYIVDPKPEFDHLVEQGYLPRGFMNSVPGKGHMNKFGHIIIGELLAEKISEIIQ